jgi:hypothetical protein
MIYEWGPTDTTRADIRDLGTRKVPVRAGFQNPRTRGAVTLTTGEVGQAFPMHGYLPRALARQAVSGVAARRPGRARRRRGPFPS